MSDNLNYRTLSGFTGASVIDMQNTGGAGRTGRGRTIQVWKGDGIQMNVTSVHDGNTSS